MLHRNQKQTYVLLALTAVLFMLPATNRAKADELKVLQFSGGVVGVEGPVIGVGGRINVHASGSIDALVGKGQDYPTGAGGNVNFYDLEGSIDGNSIVLRGVINKSTADLEGLPVRIEADSETSMIKFIVVLSQLGVPFDLVFEGIADNLVLKSK